MILFCNGVVLVLVVAFVYVAASVIWHESAAIRAFFSSCAEHGEFEDEDECPGCLPEDGASDRAYEHSVDRELGVAW